MCKIPCDKIKQAVCAHETGCCGSWFYPCGHTCFIFHTHWDKRKKEINYMIEECKTCNLKELTNDA